MFSWYPVYFPIDIPLNLKSGSTVVMDIWRCGDDQGQYRWYEWRIVSPRPSRIFNMNGQSSKIGCVWCRHDSLMTSFRIIKIKFIGLLVLPLLLLDCFNHVISRLGSWCWNVPSWITWQFYNPFYLFLDNKLGPCEPNCATFPAWKSTQVSMSNIRIDIDDVIIIFKVTVSVQSVLMEKQFVFWVQKRELFTTTKKIQENFDGLFFTDVKTRRESGMQNRVDLNWPLTLFDPFSNEASLKRRVRRNVKAAKAVAGLSYNELLAKKQQKPEVINPRCRNDLK